MGELCEIILVLFGLVLIALLKPLFEWLGIRRKLGTIREVSANWIFDIYIRHRICEAFYKVTVEGSGLEEFFRVIGEGIAEVFGADAWSILLTPHGGSWHFIAWSKAYDKSDLAKVVPHLQESGGAGEVVEKSEVVVVQDTYRHSRWKVIDELKQRGSLVAETRSWMGIPITAGDRVIGVISMDWFRPRKVKRWMRSMAEEISKEVSAKLSGMEEMMELMESVDFDPLLGIPGKKALENDFESISKEAQRVGVLVVTVENVEKLGKIYGQAAKNEIMKRAVSRLRRAVGERRRLYVVSDGLFATLLEDPTNDTVIGIKRKVISEFLRIFDVTKEGRRYFVKLNVSVGLAMYPDDSKRISELIEVARTKTL